jgi:DNA-binding transcriptional MerR regulator
MPAGGHAMKPTGVAQLLGVSPSTIRRWSGIYSRYLSMDAAGGGGRARLFQPRDVAILAYVKDQLARAATEDEVAMGLEALQDADWEGLPPVETEAPDEDEPMQQLAMFQLELMVRARQEEVARLEGELTTARGDIAQERGRIQELHTELAAARQELGVAQGRLAALEERAGQQATWLKWAFIALAGIAAVAFIVVAIAAVAP